MDEIAREMGCLGVPALSRNRIRLNERMKKDRALQKTFEELQDVWGVGARESTVKVWPQFFDFFLDLHRHFH